MQHIEQLALVLVDALDLHIKQAVGADGDACGLLDVSGQPGLVGVFDGHDLALKRGVGAVGVEPLELLQVQTPAVAQCAVEQRGQAGISLRQPAPGRHTVGHVGEALGPQVGKVGKDGFYQQIRMQCRHAVDLVAAHHRQMRHAHPALALLINQRQARQKAVVAGAVQGGHFQKFLVDAENDFKMAR